MSTGVERVTPREYGQQLARRLPPPSDEQIEKAARILATVRDDVDHDAA